MPVPIMTLAAPSPGRKYLPFILLVVMLLVTIFLWWITFTVTRTLEASTGHFISMAILLSGAFLSLLLFFMIKQQEKKYRQALILAQEMTVELEAAKKQADGLARKTELILNSAGEGIFGLDIQGDGVFVNPAAADMLGYAARELIGRPIHTLTHHTHDHDTPKEIAGCPIHQTLQDGQAHHTDEAVFWRKNGTPFPVKYTSTPMWDDSGQLTGAVITFNDITEHLRAEKDRFVRQVSEQASKSKSAFLANMSHEIRTPMNAVLGCTQLLLQDQSFSARQIELLRTIVRSGGHLLDLINDILDISRIEAGQVTLNETGFDLGNLLQDMKAIFSISAEAKGLRFFMDQDEELPGYVLADGGKLRQVLVNLLGNAIKYTQKGGVVLRVRVGETSGQIAAAGDMERCRLCFEVEDSGVGIPEEDLGKIFSPFEQVSGGVRAGGTGLGLAISSQLVRLMGGRIEVSSKAGEGSCFSFQVEVQRSESTTSREKEDTRPVVGLELGTEPVSILVVDDSEANRILLRKILEMAGFTVVEAANGREAIECFEQHSPQAVLMDIQMPVMNGLEATRRLRATDHGRGVPIIAITGNAFEDDQKEGLAIGMSAYLCKPFRTEELLRVLGRCLDLRPVHEEPAISSPPSSAAVTPQMLAAFPRELLDGLRRAVEEGDTSCLRELIDGMREKDAAVAQGLQALADRYDYQQLEALLQKGERIHG